MGIDVEFMASHFRERRGEFLPTATLRLDRDPRLLVQLDQQALPCLVHPLPEGLKVGHYDDQGLRYDDMDRYDEPLTYISPADLGRLRLPAWFKKGSGTVAGTARRVLRTTVPDPFSDTL